MHYPGGPSVIKKLLIRGRQQGQREKRQICAEGSIEREIGRCYVAGFTGSQRMQAALQKLDKAKERTLPSNLQKDRNLTNLLENF